MIEQFKKTIYQALIWGDTKLLRECFYKLKCLMLEGKIFSPEDIDFFINLLEQPKFIGLGGGWYFAMLFQIPRESLSLLLQMKYDPSEQVRDEVNTSLQRIANRGIEIRIEDIY